MKFKKITYLFINAFFYFSDFFLLVIALLINVYKFKKFYLKNLTIVTATDEIFYNSLIQLLNNIRYFESKIKIIVYDIGLTKIQELELLNNFPQIIYKEFIFENYPDFISIRDEHSRIGNYAWKSIILNNETKVNHDLLIWFDSANLISKKLIRLRIVLSAFGFYSPYSTGKLSDWTHFKTSDFFMLEKKILNKRNLTGGIVGVNCNNILSKNLISDWEFYCGIKECIAPFGSNRDNHRQDQTILSILKHTKYRKLISPKMKNNFGIKVNQNPDKKIYLTDSSTPYLKELKKEILKVNFRQTVNSIHQAKFIWIMNSDDYKVIKRNYLNSKYLIVSIFKDDKINLKNLNKIKKASRKEVYLFVHKNNKEVIPKSVLEDYIIKKFSDEKTLISLFLELI